MMMYCKERYMENVPWKDMLKPGFDFRQFLARYFLQFLSLKAKNRLLAEARSFKQEQHIFATAALHF